MWLHGLWDSVVPRSTNLGSISRRSREHCSRAAHAVPLPTMVSMDPADNITKAQPGPVPKFGSFKPRSSQPPNDKPGSDAKEKAKDGPKEHRPLGRGHRSLEPPTPQTPVPSRPKSPRPDLQRQDVRHR